MLFKHGIMLVIGSVNMLIKFIVSLITYVFYLVLKNLRQLYILKNNKYKNEKYLSELKVFKNVWLEPALLSVFLLIFWFYKNSIFCMITFILIYMVSSLFLLHQNKKIKKPLNEKDKKMLFFNLLIYLLLIVLFVSVFVEEYIAMYLLVLFLVAYLSPIWLLFTNAIANKFKKTKKSRR